MHKMLSDAKSVAVTMHIRPDGDSIGSALALRGMLTKMGKKVDVYADGEVPDSLSYLADIDKIIKTDDEGEPPHYVRYDLLVIVDTGDKHRVGLNQFLFDCAKKVLVFDHHLNPTIEADLIISNPMRASVGEMMFEFFTAHNVKIDKKMAEALYTAVASDTGCFLFPNTNWYTHHVASELLKLDIDIANINYKNFRVYDPKTLAALMSVLETIRFVHNGQIAITYLDYKLVTRWNFNHDERHRFQRYASDADGVKVSIFLTEQERDEFNISLRSHDEVNVADVARHFGGGGHKNAAGLTMTGRYKDVIKQIVDKVIEVLK